MLAHYASNSQKILHQYCDCKCSFDSLNKTNPKCGNVTVEEIQSTREITKQDATLGKEICWAMSKHNIDNVILDAALPLSNQIHRAMKMMIMYIFESLIDTLKLEVERHEHVGRESKIFPVKNLWRGRVTYSFSWLYSILWTVNWWWIRWKNKTNWHGQ